MTQVSVPDTWNLRWRITFLCWGIFKYSVPICNVHYQTGMSIWGLFDRTSSSWNNLKCQLNAIRKFYWCILSSTCFGYIRPSSEASDVELQHMVFCTEFLDGWSWEPLRRSCVRCGWCRRTRCTKPYAATQHLMLLMMGVCAWNISS